MNVRRRREIPPATPEEERALIDAAVAAGRTRVFPPGATATDDPCASSWYRRSRNRQRAALGLPPLAPTTDEDRLARAREVDARNSALKERARAVIERYRRTQGPE